MFYMCQSVYLARCILQQHFLPMSAFNVTDTVTFTASALKLALIPGTLSNLNLVRTRSRDSINGRARSDYI